MKGGRIVFELFEECKKTAENFVAISQGFKISKTTRKPLHYANTPIHRLVPKFIFQGGDVTRFDGSGGESIYGPTFSDEKPGLKIPFERGTLGMANRGKNSNSSQFFVCLGDGEKLKGRYVAFGKVKEGWDVLELIEAVEVDGESPKEKVTVVACGVL
ncbi:peptidyl-prolyl cis-trans isomerase [Gaertneriomyces semiglobifer]|nr:peptidyl-prolyl cis-trans isomerase [Gaertneriomyces semiglobifer]